MYKFTVTLFILFILEYCVLEVTAQLSLSTTGDVQCYGEQVTLLCTHPVLPQEPEYLQADVSWRRDGRAISTVGLGRTNPTSTTTKLEFTITNSTVGNYTCFLVNAVRGGADESNTATVRPRDHPRPPEITTVESLTTRVSLTWTHNTECFDASEIEYEVTWLNEASGEDGSGWTADRSYTIRTSRRGVYRVRVTATVRGGAGGGGVVTSPEDSGTEVVVHAGYPMAQGTENGPCFGRPFYLICFHDYTTSSVTWTGNRSGIGNGNQLYSVKDYILEIRNVTRDLFSNVVTTFQCAAVVNGTMISGEPYQMDPNEHPLPSSVAVMYSTHDTVVLTLDHSPVCFEVFSFFYKISWRTEGGEWSGSVVPSSTKTYTIGGLSPASEYRVRVSVVSGEDSTVAAEPVTIRAVTLAGPVIAVAASVGLLSVAMTITSAVLLLFCFTLLRSKRKYRQTNTGNTDDDDDVHTTMNPSYVPSLSSPLPQSTYVNV